MIQQERIDIGGVELTSSDERLQGELESRHRARDRMCRFGVQYLDDACRGIFSNDFVLIGARTGVGKTQLATLIAKENISDRRVHYIALEAEPYEIERRILYQEFSHVFFDIAKEYRNTKKKLNYLDWYRGDFDPILDKYYPEIRASMAERLSNLVTHYRPNGCNYGELVKDIYQIQNDADLIILDHLHYIDFETQNENAGYKALTKELRATALSIGKPIIAIVHVRKADRKLPEITPVADDIHGSSDIAKIGTNIIMLSRMYEESPEDPFTKTHIRIVKHRKDGTLTGFVGTSQYNWKKQAYSDRYWLSRIGPHGDSLVVINHSQAPDWAAHAIWDRSV